MSCPYYWWNHNYACRKSGKDVSEDIYYKYCRNYDYSDCPIYRQQSPSDSSCYLTTACIKARNLPDDCRELKILRQFRDTYLKTFEQGRQDVKHYYEIAPKVVAAIERENNAEEVFEQIYSEIILTCVDLIISGQNQTAYEKYKAMALELEDKYLKGKHSI